MSSIVVRLVYLLVASFIGAGIWVGLNWLAELRRERYRRALLRRRYQREIDHPTTWGGKDAA